ncbi:MAG: ATP synthase F1 subunit epsilon [Firmicutes bacterium]|jgi:F-type H+-transporting ATPase subunit epsilon|nr:ATP synthase F1 subunit epsilon [Bacillota bacterium]
MAIEQNSSESKKKITLNITTPRGLKYVEQADMLIMRCVDGDLGVLPGHAPVSAVLGDGILRIFNNGGEQKLAVFGGIVEINDTTVNMFTTIAQRPEEIDRERAEVDFRRAEATIIEQLEEQDLRRLQVLMHRALVRLEVSSHADDTGYADNNS